MKQEKISLSLPFNAPANWIAFLFYLVFFLLLTILQWIFFSSPIFQYKIYAWQFYFLPSKISNRFAMWFLFLLVSTEFVTLCCTPNLFFFSFIFKLKRKTPKKTHNPTTTLHIIHFLFSSILISFTLLLHFSTWQQIFIVNEWKKHDSDYGESTKKKNLLLNSFIMNACWTHWKTKKKTTPNSKRSESQISNIAKEKA